MRLALSPLVCLGRAFLVAAGFSFLTVHSVTAAEECTQLTATGNSEYPPFLWRQAGSRQLDGAVADFVGELGERIGVTVNVVDVGPWSRAQEEVRSGRIDLMAGAFYTTARSDYMEYFSPAMLYTRSVVWQGNQRPFEFHRRSDLKGRWGVTVINNSFGQSFDEYARKNLNLLTVASLEQAFSMLSSGRADYALYERSPGLAYRDKLGFEEQVIEIDPPISSEGLFLTFSKASPCNTPKLKQRIADALRAMHTEGIAKQAVKDALEEWNQLNTK